MTQLHLIERVQKKFPQAGEVEIRMLADQAVREFHEHCRGNYEKGTLQTDAEIALYGFESIVDINGASIAGRIIAVNSVSLGGIQLPRRNTVYGFYGLCWWVDGTNLGIGFNDGGQGEPRPHFPDGKIIEVEVLSQGKPLSPGDMQATLDIDPRFVTGVLNYINGWLAEENSSYQQAEHHFDRWEKTKRDGRISVNQGDTSDSIQIRPLPL